MLKGERPLSPSIFVKYAEDYLNTFELTLLIWIASLAAGFLGALTGLGGGFVSVPALSLVFGVDIRYAIGASLISVIATSSGAAAAYVKEGFTDLRIGMFLEIATTFRGADRGLCCCKGLNAGYSCNFRLHSALVRL